MPNYSIALALHLKKNNLIINFIRFFYYICLRLSEVNNKKREKRENGLGCSQSD